MFERTVAARVCPIAPQLLSVLLVRVVVLQLFASRAAIHILIAEIDEVLLPKRPFASIPDVIGFEASRRFLLCRSHDFLAAEVAAISNGFEFVDAEDFLRL